MKKFFSLLLAVLMVVGMFPVSAFAETVPSITAAANKTAAAIGDEIEVTFTLANNPGFTNIELTLDFDETVLKFTGLKINPDTETPFGRFGGGTTDVNIDPYHEKYGFIGNARGTATTTDGDLFIAVFEVIGVGDTTVGATVDKFRLVENDGTLTDHASSVAVTATGDISVAGIPATSITLDKNELTLEEGRNHLLKVTVDPENTTDKVTFESDNEGVATVSPAGKIEAIKAGEATITVTAGSVSETCVVTVEKEESIVHKSPDGYVINATAEMTGVKSLVVGGSTETVKNIYKLPLTGHEGAWVHMDDAGTGQGAAYKLDGTAVFGVPFGVDLTKFNINVSYASAYTADLLVTEAELTAAVGADNVSKLGLSADKLYAFLYIEDPWQNRNCGILFEITPVAATGVEVQETMALSAGKSGELNVSVLPASNTDDLTITYSSGNEAVATVDADGKVTAVAPGTAVITVTAGSFTDTCTVTVESAPVEIENVPCNSAWDGSTVNGISIKGVTVDSYAWDGFTLNVYITEDTATAKVIFSAYNSGYDQTYEETVAIANGSGKLNKSITLGPSYYSSTTDYVINFSKSVPATDISLEKSETSIRKGGNETLVVKLTPENTTDSITWSSSDESVATVDANGKVEGISEGKAIITVKSGDLKDSCEVSVILAHAQSVTIVGDGVENGKLRVLKDKQIELSEVTEPAEHTDSITWSSSDESVATVNAKGKVKGISEGNARITVTVGEVSNYIEVEVYEVPVEKITLDKTEATIFTVEALILKATTEPAEHTDGKIQWSSSDTTVATVASNGVVSPVKAGEAIITAKVGNASATCKVTITEPEEGTVIWRYDGNTNNVWPNRNYYINALVVNGAKVDSVPKENGVYTVTLPHATAKDAEISLKACAGGLLVSQLGVNWHESEEDPQNWSNYANELEHTVKLVDGKATVKVRAYKASGAGASRDGTKTFKFVIGGECLFDQEVATEKYFASEATCTEAAKYYKSCVCGAKGTETFYSGSVNTQNHKPANKWTADDANDTHYHECENGCGEKLDVTSCSGGNATCTDKAVCDYCNQEYGNALDHDWDEVKYNFAEDGKSCTATRECNRDASHKETATASITSAVKTPAECEVNGWTTYTATFSEDWADTQTKDVQDIPALQHDWDEVKYNFAEDGKSCTAERVCKRNAQHVETAQASISSAVTKKPNCSEKGETTYTATFSEYWAATQTKTVKDIAVDPDNHTFGAAQYTWTDNGTKCTASRRCINTADGDRCNETETAEGSMTSKVTTPATCTVKGWTTYTATFTVDWAETKTNSVQDVAIDEDAHKYDEGKITTPATCSKEGVKTFTCEYNAQHTYTEKVAIDPDAHDWKGADGVTNVTTTKAPTCTEKGERKFTCEHNKEHFYTEEIDALGHEMGEWEVVEKATYSKKGLMERKCVREGCTYKETKDIPKLVADEDDEIRGVTIITPGEKIEEENPNTGAPVVGIAPFAVLAAAAVVSKFRRK